MTSETTIDSIIIGNFTNSRNFLLNFFGLGASSFEALEGYVKLLAALRGLPQEAMEDIASPILRRMFAEMGFDPERDRVRAAPFVDLFALAIQDATTMIIQNMEHQSQAAAALRTGRGSMLQV